MLPPSPQRGAQKRKTVIFGVKSHPLTAATWYVNKYRMISQYETPQYID